MADTVSRGTSQTSENSQTSQNPDYATWLTKQQAAEAIGVSTKTIESFAKDRKIQQAAWRPQGRGAEKAVYNPDDVARMVQERRPGLTPFVLPAGAASNGNGHDSSIAPIRNLDNFNQADEDPIRRLFGAALRAVLSPPVLPTSENSEKLFLSIPEAAQVSGLSRTYVRRLIDEQKLPAVKDGRSWRIRRKDLEAL